jgi:hypothetical protein
MFPPRDKKWFHFFVVKMSIIFGGRRKLANDFERFIIGKLESFILPGN